MTTSDVYESVTSKTSFQIKVGGACPATVLEIPSGKVLQDAIFIIDTDSKLTYKLFNHVQKTAAGGLC